MKKISVDEQACKNLYTDVEAIEKVANNAITAFESKHRPVYLGEVALAIKHNLKWTIEIVRCLVENGIVRQANEDERSSIGALKEAELYVLVR